MGSRLSRSTTWRSGKTFLMLSMKISHSLGPQKSSAMKKPPQQEFAEGFGLGIGQLPMAGLHGIEPGPVGGAAFVQIDGLFDGADVEARQAAEGLHEVAVGARIILGPHGVAFGPLAAASKAKAEAAPAATVGGLRVHEAGEGPLGLLLKVGRKRDVAESVFHARKFAERQLETVQNAEEGKAGSQRLGRTHEGTPSVRIAPEGVRPTVRRPVESPRAARSSFWGMRFVRRARWGQRRERPGGIRA